MKKNLPPKQISPWEKKYRRYHRNYRLIVCLSLAITATIWYFAGHFWGIVALLFVICSETSYDKGATEKCMDEYEYARFKDGFRRMLRSWPWLAILAIIAYFFCKKFMPWLF